MELVLVQQFCWGGEVGHHHSFLFPVAVLHEEALAELMPAGWSPAELLHEVNGRAPGEEYPHMPHRRKGPVAARAESAAAREAPGGKTKEALTVESVGKALEALQGFAAARQGFECFRWDTVCLPAGATVSVLCQVFYDG